MNVSPPFVSLSTFHQAFSRTVPLDGFVSFSLQRIFDSLLCLLQGPFIRKTLEFLFCLLCLLVVSCIRALFLLHTFEKPISVFMSFNRNFCLRSLIIAQWLMSQGSETGFGASGLSKWTCLSFSCKMKCHIQRNMQRWRKKAKHKMFKWCEM